MQDFLVDILQCPDCHGALHWIIAERRGERIEEAEARCESCQTTYPVREGIGIFLIAERPEVDLWEQVESGLSQYLRLHPETERLLMDSPLESLSPADQFYRAMVLEERGLFDKAQAIMGAVTAGLYTPEYMICYESQIHYLVQQLAEAQGPVVDLASGRGDLVKELVKAIPNPVIATDVSPLVLWRDRLWLEHFGLYERVSLLAFDARRTPFKDGAIGTMTTNAGLANIREPGALLEELRRVVQDGLLAIHFFYPPEDEIDRSVIEALGLSAMLYRLNAAQHFDNAGWKLRVENICSGRALPTPKSVLLEGAGIDGLPQAETTLEWCTLVAG